MVLILKRTRSVEELLAILSSTATVLFFSSSATTKGTIQTAVSCGSRRPRLVARALTVECQLRIWCERDHGFCLPVCTERKSENGEQINARDLGHKFDTNAPIVGLDRYGEHVDAPARQKERESATQSRPADQNATSGRKCLGRSTTRVATLVFTVTTRWKHLSGALPSTTRRQPTFRPQLSAFTLNAP